MAISGSICAKTEEVHFNLLYIDGGILRTMPVVAHITTPQIKKTEGLPDVNMRNTIFAIETEDVSVNEGVIETIHESFPRVALARIPKATRVVHKPCICCAVQHYMGSMLRPFRTIQISALDIAVSYEHRLDVIEFRSNGYVRGHTLLLDKSQKLSRMLIVPDGPEADKYCSFWDAEIIRSNSNMICDHVMPMCNMMYRTAYGAEQYIRVEDLP